MQYIFKILSDIPVTAQYSLGGKELTFPVLVKDLESGEVVEYMVRRLIHSSVLGVGIHADHITCAVIEMSRKKALLHRYVEAIEWERGLPDLKVTSSKEDLLTLHRDSGGRFTGVNNDDIGISTSGEMIQAFGHLGSVVLRYETLRSSPKVRTLYDLLCELCVESACNIMKYHTIRLYSELRAYTLTLRLANSDEAVRFYNKMYLDALQGGTK